MYDNGEIERCLKHCGTVSQSSSLRRIIEEMQIHHFCFYFVPKPNPQCQKIAYLSTWSKSFTVSKYCVLIMSANFLGLFRFELPGVHAFHFVLKNSLGGGGVASLRPDPQGKGYGQMILDLVLDVSDQ